MKRIFLVFVSILVGKTWAVTPIPYTEAVSFSLGITGSGAAGTTTIFDESGSPSVNQTGPASGMAESAIGTALLKPGKLYTVSTTAPAATTTWLSFIVPAGYTLLVDGIPTNLVQNPSPGASNPFFNYIELRPEGGYEGAPLGSFSGVKFGSSISWEIGLGNLHNGRSAGSLVFKEKDFSNSPAARARLYYSPPGNYGEITVIKDGSLALRQINVPQGFVDLMDDAGGGYWIKFYRIDQIETAPPGSVWLVKAGQNPWKTIRVEMTASYRLRMTEHEN